MQNQAIDVVNVAIFPARVMQHVFGRRHFWTREDSRLAHVVPYKYIPSISLKLALYETKLVNPPRPRPRLEEVDPARLAAPALALVVGLVVWILDEQVQVPSLLVQRIFVRLFQMRIQNNDQFPPALIESLHHA